MRSTAILLSFLALFSQFAFSDTTFVSGTYDGDSTWTSSGSPYIIQSSVTISSTGSLTINPGVTVSGGALIVAGGIYADYVTFEYGVSFGINAGSHGSITNSNLLGGGSSGFYFPPSANNIDDFTISDNTISNFNQAFTIQSDFTSLTVTDNVFSNCNGGIYTDPNYATSFSSQIIGNTFQNMTGIALDLYDCDGTTISYCEFLNSPSFAAIEINNSSPLIYNCTMDSCFYGLFLNNCYSDISDCEISRCTYPVIYYNHSNPTYSNNNLHDNQNEHMLVIEGSSGDSSYIWSDELFPGYALTEYKISNQFAISSNGSLTIDSGVTVSGGALIVAGGIYADYVTFEYGVSFGINAGSHGSITNSNLLGGGSSGFYFPPSANNIDDFTISDNTISNFNQAFTIQSDFTSLTVTDNVFSNCNGGIYTDPNYATSFSSQIIGNTFQNMTGIALDLYDCDGTTISYCQFINSPTTTGILIRNGLPTINCCSFSNLQIAISNLSSTIINAEHNWWDSQNGPTYVDNPIGDGEIISDFIDYEPWLMEPPNIDGGLSGYVTEINSSNPISGAIVKTTFGYSDTTDSNGHFRIRLIPPGYGYNVWVYAGGFQPDTIYNITINDESITTVDFQLEVALYNSFVIEDFVTNPIESNVEIGGVFHRYYYLYDSVLNLPIIGAYVIMSPVDSFITDENGIADIQIPSDYIGSEDGDIQSFSILEISLSSIRFPLMQSANFNATLENRYYSYGWENSKYSKLGFSIFQVKKGEGSSFTLLETDQNQIGWDSVYISRQNRAELGAEFKLGSPFQSNIGPAKLQAEAGIEVFAAVKHQDEYLFDYANYDDMDAINMYILFADGNVTALDNALIRLLGYIEQIFSGQNSFDIAYRADEVGLEMGGGISGEAKFGLNSEPGNENNMFLGIGGSLSGSASGYFSTKYYRHENKVHAKIGASGQANGEAFAGLKLPVLGGSTATNELPYYISPIGIGFTGGVGIGGEFGAVYPLESIITEKLYIKWSYNYSLMSNKYEKTTTYSISGSDLLESLKNQVSIIGSIAGYRSSDQTIGLTNTSISSPLEIIFNTAYNFQTDESGIASINYTREFSKKTNISSFSIGLDLGTAGVEAKIGGGISFSSIVSYDTLRGVWFMGKHYPLEEYPPPDYPETNYDDIMDEICDNIPIAIKIAAFTINIIDLIFKDKDSNTFYIVDSTGTDTTGQLYYTDQTFPDTLDQVECFTWGWWGSSPFSLKNNLSEKDAQNYERLKKTAERNRGMHYGYGGFYQFEPIGVTLEDTAILTIRYLDEEIEGFDESELAMYLEDKNSLSWIFIGGTIDTNNNTVTSEIDILGTYTLAPRLPYGNIGLNPTTDSIPADGLSSVMIYSDTIFNNDSTIIADSTEITIEAQHGTFLTFDSDTLRPGLQLYSTDGLISFEIQSTDYARDVLINAYSTYGSAFGETIVTFVDQGPPSPPNLLSLEPMGNSIKVIWRSNPEIDIKGYKAHYDLDSGEPYEGIASILGYPSPVDVGDDTSFTITGLESDTTYYVSITAYDVSNNESQYSNELAAFTLSYTCGDVNADTIVNIFDITYLISYLYLGGPPPNELNSADVNKDYLVNIFDITYLITYLYLEGPEPVCP